MERHCFRELISPYGIIGLRGPEFGGEVYYNHMPAADILRLLGDEIWNGYFKFCVVRNPFDKVVSMFWMQLPEEDRGRLSIAPFVQVRDRFRAYCLAGHDLPVDWYVYTVNDQMAADGLIRYEHLLADLEVVCQRLSIPFTPAALGQYKREYRMRRENFADYYDAETQDSVVALFGRDFDMLGYSRQLPGFQ